MNLRQSTPADSSPQPRRNVALEKIRAQQTRRAYRASLPYMAVDGQLAAQGRQRPLGGIARGARSAMFGAAISLGALGPAAALTGCSDSTPEAVAEVRAELRGDSELIAHFREAERETGVPAELLATIAWMQTRLTAHVPDAEHVDESAEEHPHHPPREWGLMGIGTARLTTLEEAARAVGSSTHEVAHEPRTNVRAAAALLAKLRAKANAEGARDDWSAAVEAYGGPDLAEAVDRLLRTGFRAADDDGREVEVVGHGVLAGGSLGERVGVARQALGYPGAKWNPAYGGNYKAASRGAKDINYVVIHTVQGSYSGCISWFKNPSAKVSAHYVVRSSDGEVTQMVDDSDIAYHDGCFNTHSIGIEHEGYVSEPAKWYTDTMYASSAKLTAWLCDSYGIPKDRAHIMGHGETPDCSSHTDPGSGWNWTKYMSLVASGGVVAPPEYMGESIGAEGQSYPVASKGAVTIEVGQTVKGWVKLRNKGSKTWKPGVVKLAPIPRDKASPYASPSWLSSNRISTVSKDIPPNSVGEFPLDITGSAVGEGTLQLGWVAENVTWFADKPRGGGPADGYFQVRVKVVPAPKPPPPPPDPSSASASTASASSANASGAGGSETPPEGVGGAGVGGMGGAVPLPSEGGGGDAGTPSELKNAAIEGQACAASPTSSTKQSTLYAAAALALSAALRRRRRPVAG